MRTIRVEREETSEAARKIELLGSVLGIEDKSEFNWDFEPTYSNEAVASVDQYMKESGTDILALSYHHRELFEKLFRENVAKKVSRVADYPMLVFWH